MYDELNSIAMSTLRNCARSIASGCPSRISGTDELSEGRGNWIMDAPQYLADQVWEESDHRFTVRVADEALFVDHGRDTCLYLVRCPASPDGPGHAKDMVTELTEDMFLVYIAPVYGGFDMYSTQASPEQVAKFRNQRETSRAKQAQMDRAADAARPVIASIKKELKRHIDACSDHVLRTELREEYWAEVAFSENLSLETIARIGYRVVSLEDLLLDALSTDLSTH